MRNKHKKQKVSITTTEHGPKVPSSSVSLIVSHDAFIIVSPHSLYHTMVGQIQYTDVAGASQDDHQPIIYAQVNKDTSLGAYCYVAPPVPEKNKDVPSEYCVAMATDGNGGEVSTEEPGVTSEYCEVSHHDQVPSNTEQSALSALSTNPSVPTQDGSPNEPVVSEYSVAQPIAGDSVPQQPVSSSSQQGLYDRLQHNLGITSSTGSTTHDTASQYESLHRHGNGNTTTLSKGQLLHIM